MKYKIILLSIILLFSCNRKSDFTQEVNSPYHPVYADFENFSTEVLDTAYKETVVLINFWATWCSPCVKEMPLFFEAMDSEAYGDVKFLYVSMDFEKDVETKLLPYIEANNIAKHTVLLTAPRPNRWIDKVDPSWTGALPFTLVLGRDGRRAAHEGRFHSVGEIDSLIQMVK